MPGGSDDVNSTASYDEEFERSLRSFQERLNVIVNGGSRFSSPDMGAPESLQDPG